MNPVVYILTYCRRPELLYGTTLIFDTVRVGFPTADIRVVDNASVLEVRPRIAALAQKAGACFNQLHNEVRPCDFYASVIDSGVSKSVIFIDPDIVFWSNCERENYDALIAGRVIPKFKDEYTGCVTMERIHMSFFWVPSTTLLKKRIVELKQRFFDWNPFAPFMFKDREEWYRFDTGASLYSALGSDAIGFPLEQLERYDHLFCGSHIDLVMPSLKLSDRERWVRTHSLACSDPTKLKGIWREQEDYFQQRRVLNGNSGGEK